MSHQSRAIMLSVLVHALAFAAVAGISGSQAARKSLVIDFSILAPARQAAASTEKIASVAEKKARKPARPNKKKARDEISPTAPVPAVAELPAPELPTEAEVPEQPAEQAEQPDITPEMAAFHEISDTVSPDRGDPGVDPVVPSALTNSPSPPVMDFSHIRDKVQRNISYPGIARRMGWEGKVTLSFTICCNGTVKDVKIVESSGNKVLDKNAVESVEKTTPFPPQKMEARVIIPVLYRLYESN